MTHRVCCVVKPQTSKEICACMKHGSAERIEVATHAFSWSPFHLMRACSPDADQNTFCSPALGKIKVGNMCRQGGEFPKFDH